MKIKDIALLPELTEKFEANHTKGEGCWIWTGAITGYGRDRGSLAKTVGGTRYTYGAHRYSYTLYVGTIPGGLELDHLCKNPICVNPSHLEPVTGAENKRREKWRKTHCKRGHEFIPENRLKGDRSICKLCVRSYARAKRLGITVDEAVAREAELDKRFERPAKKPFVSKLSYRVDWENDPHCRDCGHLLYSDARSRIAGARVHAGKGRCWRCKQKFDKLQKTL